MISLLLADWMPLCSPALAAEPAHSAAPSVTVLKDRFIEAGSSAERTKILDQIAKTPPVSGQDVAHLFDLFSRFTDAYTRDSVMASTSPTACMVSSSK